MISASLGVVAATLVVVLAGCAAPAQVDAPSDTPSPVSTERQVDPSSQPLAGPGVGDDPLAQGAAPPPSNVDENGYSYTVESYLAWVIADLDAKWTPWFVSRSYSEPNVRYVVIKPGESFRSTCTNMPPLTDTTPNAYYCSSDDGGGGAIWLPVTTFQKMWAGDVFARPSQRVGDFAAAIITAHEFGHHVTDELYQQSAKANPGVAVVTGANKELIADCFAGVWAATAYHDGLLEPGDFEEAVAALAAIGDTTTNGVDPHGTPAERVAALQVGYNAQADPTPCVQSYWR